MIRSLSRRSRPAALVAICLAVASGCGGTPQLGDKDCLKAADALWTAVTARRSDLLETSARQIEELHAAAKLTPDAFDSLLGVVEMARAGQWTDARVSLKALIRGQRAVQRIGGTNIVLRDAPASK